MMRGAVIMLRDGRGAGHHASQKSHLGKHAFSVIFVLNFLWKGEYFVMTTTPRYAEGIQINAPVSSEFAEILTPEAMDFVGKLIRTFSGRREELLRRRVLRQAEIDAGKMPDFLPETENIRNSDWTVAPLPNDLLDRRVEITGPSDRR